MEGEGLLPGFQSLESSGPLKIKMIPHAHRLVASLAIADGPTIRIPRRTY
jgi:hypothetical protein